MQQRPLLSNTLASNLFLQHYYLKQELIAFCRENGLQTAGGKQEITKRIACYLDTGEKREHQPSTRAKGVSGTIAADAIIEDGFVCSQKHRLFFEQQLGKGFRFTVPFQKWLKANAGKTYREAMEAYRQIINEQKYRRQPIDDQFEYNAYIRDFFADQQGKSLGDAIQCWKAKKAKPGNHRYERADVSALE